MKKQLVSLALTAIISAPAFAQDYDAPRDATVNASGATMLRIDARAGNLRVTGRADITEVRVRGTARASSKGMLEDIKLEAVRTGNEIHVRADIPEQRNNSWRWNEQALLDLVLEVPTTLPLDIEDTSGDITVESVAAKVRIDDNSGNIRVRETGDIWITDSSGGIDIRNVKGSVDIDEDSSGEIEVYDVTGSVHIGRDSSGGIDVSRVGGDFIVERDGSGSIDYDGVKGKVDIPSKDRHRSRSYNRDR
jgi:hypothetical protein